MADKWVQSLTKLAGEYQQESASGKKADKGKFIQKAMKLANEMTDDIQTDEEKKKKHKQMLGMVEGFAAKIYGFDPNENDNENENNNENNSLESATSSKPPKNRPPPGKPSYLIPKPKPKEEETDTTETNATETDTAESVTKPPKSEPQTGENESSPPPVQLQMAKERAEAQVQLDAATAGAATNEENPDASESKPTTEDLKVGAAVTAGVAAAAAAATTAAFVATKQKANADESNTASTSSNRPGENDQEENDASHPAPSAPPASDDTEYYSVVVPEGIRPGMDFQVDVGGTRFEVTCPPTVQAGQKIRVQLPIGNKTNTPNPQGAGNQGAGRKPQRSKSPKKDASTDSKDDSLHYVTVPPGISAGMPFRVDVKGIQFTVTCPPTAKAGQKVAVQVPRRGRSTSPKPVFSQQQQQQQQQQTQSQQQYLLIPPNVHPGMTFGVTVQGKPVQVRCPPNTRPGQRTLVNLPGHLRPSSRSKTPPPTVTNAARREYFDVVVPPNVFAGQQFNIHAKGHAYYVTCPPNAGPGQTVRVPIVVNTSGSGNTIAGRVSSKSPVRLYNPRERMPRPNLQPYV